MAWDVDRQENLMEQLGPGPWSITVDWYCTGILQAL